MKNIKDFFFTDNLSGHKTKETWLSKHHPDLYKLIIENSIDITIPFKEKVWLYINGYKEIPKCPICGKNSKFRGDLTKGFPKHCSMKCLNQSEEHKKKIEDFNMLNYGVKSHNQVTSIKEKKKQILIEKYGVDNPMRIDGMNKKFKQILIEKYGVDTPMKIERVIKERNELIKTGNDPNMKRMLNRIKDINIHFIEYDLETKDLHFRCDKCNSNFSINNNLLCSRLKNDNEICVNCNAKKSYSKIVKIISNKLIENNIEFILNDRKILNRKEIDFYFPKYKLGIELNGLFWHSEKFKNNEYHLIKTSICETKNIKLYHFFEDEILYKLDIVLYMIKNELENYDDFIIENNFYVKEINDFKIVNDFLNKNYIKQIEIGNINLGLYDLNNKLISLLCLNKLNDESNFEILVFCNKINILIKYSEKELLDFFIKSYKPKSIIYFLDKRYPTHNLYLNLGFKLVYNTNINYEYYKAGKLIRYSKNIIKKMIMVRQRLKIKKSISKLMYDFKYYKIYDCGQSKYELTF